MVSTCIEKYVLVPKCCQHPKRLIVSVRLESAKNARVASPTLCFSRRVTAVWANRILGSHTRQKSRNSSTSTDEPLDPAKTISADPLANPPPEGFRMLVKSFYPFETMCDVVPESEVRERVTTFAVHAGLLYALMGSASVAGILFDPSAAGVAAAADTAVTASCVTASCGGQYTATAFLSEVTGADVLAMHKYALDWIAVFFVGSAALNIHGILNSMLVVGRVNVVPDSKVPEFEAVFLTRDNVVLFDLGDSIRLREHSGTAQRRLVPNPFRGMPLCWNDLCR
eukprot:m.167610 g.167610  ORF g.167610 m.167610 type:complete len:283 (-) comp14735_c0_seq10:274-1122(-)